MLVTLGLRSELYEHLLQTHGVTPHPETQTASLGGTRSKRQGAVAEFELAGKTHKNLLAIESGSTSLLGLNYLRRYMVTFDLGAARIYLAPGFENDRPERDAEVGIGCLRREEDTVVEAVTEGSRAARAGFQLGDKLISIDDVEVADKPTAEIKWLLQRKANPSHSQKVVVLRRGSLQTLSVECD